MTLFFSAWETTYLFYNRIAIVRSLLTSSCVLDIIRNKYRALNVHGSRAYVKQKVWQRESVPLRSSSTIFATPFCPPPATSEHQWCIQCVAYRDKPWSIAGKIWPLLPSRELTIDWLDIGDSSIASQKSPDRSNDSISRHQRKKATSDPAHEPSPCDVRRVRFFRQWIVEFRRRDIRGRYLARARSIIKRSRSQL